MGHTLTTYKEEKIAVLQGVMTPLELRINLYA
jgi:hypothetical protein